MIRPLRGDELARASHVLADAFMDDPLYRCLAPAPLARERWLRWIMGMFVRVSHRAGGAYCLARAPAAGALCVIPPERGLPSLTDYLRAAPGVPPLGSGSAAFLRRGAVALRLLQGAHPAGVHCYLLAVGVSPREQGKRIGAALVDAALGLAASWAVPAYLETASAKNLAAYQRLGFRVERAFTPDELPPLWTMRWAAPSRSDGAPRPGRQATGGDGFTCARSGLAPSPWPSGHPERPCQPPPPGLEDGAREGAVVATSSSSALRGGRRPSALPAK